MVLFGVWLIALLFCWGSSHELSGHEIKEHEPWYKHRPFKVHPLALVGYRKAFLKYRGGFGGGAEEYEPVASAKFVESKGYKLEGLGNKEVHEPPKYEPEPPKYEPEPPKYEPEP
ncbi:unnamed protein product, partial [Soboliphyme baturini]|uniref:Proline rich salivary protein n=1 Tax=Soboliphyme baturini TaxID=241478 RepID=A0A183I9M8_9BILA